MKQEEKQLLLQDLCARLHYGIFVEDGRNKLDNYPVIYTIDYHPCLNNCRPYLRPMSSMTEEEKQQINDLQSKWYDKSIELQLKALDGKKVDDIDLKNTEFSIKASVEVSNFCYKNHLDCNGLIEKGLVLEAPKGMYNK